MKSSQIVCYSVIYAFGYMMLSIYLLTRIRLVELISRGLLYDTLFTMAFGVLLLKRKYGYINFASISLLVSVVLVLLDFIFLQTQSSVWGEEGKGEPDIELSF